MKKSKLVSLVLITAALASCQKDKEKGMANEKKVYMRSDSTAGYSQSHCYGHGNGSFWMWYYAFRPYGNYGSDNHYSRAGYYSSGLSHSSNMGTSSTKTSIMRGGFGKSGYSVSS